MGKHVELAIGQILDVGCGQTCHMWLHTLHSHQHAAPTFSECTTEQISLKPSGLPCAVKQSGALYADASVPRASVDSGAEACSGVDSAGN